MAKPNGNYVSDILATYSKNEPVVLNVAIKTETNKRIDKKINYIEEILTASDRKVPANKEEFRAEIINEILNHGLNSDPLFLKYEETAKIPVTNGQNSPRQNSNSRKAEDKKNEDDSEINKVLDKNLGS